MSSSERWLLRDVTIGGARWDCRLRDGVIAELGLGLTPGDERLLDAQGGALLPGLADHHLHVLALAAARASLDLGGRARLEDAVDEPGVGWLRVVGAGAEFARSDVDRRWPDRPVRVQHRGGRLWTLNSVAVGELAGALTTEERVTGQLWESDGRLREMLGEAGLPDCAAVGRELAAHGITHVTDATPDLDAETLEAIRGVVPQHVASMAAAGRAPRKLVLSDIEPPDLPGMCEAVGAAHAAGRPVAIHTVTTVTLALALAVLGQTGVVNGDRLEHVAMCDDDAAARIAELGLTVVTQPTIYARHATAFREASAPAERELLWRHASLIDRGVRVAVSSDAPYGDPDPAATLRACARRPVEGIPPRDALATMLSDPDDPPGPPRELSAGVVADLCLLRGELPAALDMAVGGGAWPVAATFVAGQLAHPSLNHLSV